MDIKNKLKLILTGTGLAFYAAMPVMADDIEIYTSGALGAPTVFPNIMFVVDTSGSMGADVEVDVDYVTSTLYPGSGSVCDKDSLYYSTDGSLPGCGGGEKNFFDKAANKCDSSVNTYDAGVVFDTVGPLERFGFYVDQLAQRRTSGPNSNWQGLDTNQASEKGLFIECKADSGIHGETGATSPYIEDNNSGGWTSTAPVDPANPHPVWSSGINNYTLYDGNYLNYLNSVNGTQVISRLDVVKASVQALVETNNSFNLGLMVFDSQANQWEGGSVQFPSLPTTLTRNDFRNRLGNLDADGSTPLSEVYYEALLYHGGKEIVYGDAANPANQTGTKEAGSITPGSGSYYQTPITETCQKNYIVLLSDGAPQLDYISEARRQSLSNTFAFGECNTDPDPGMAVLTLSEYNKNAATSIASTNDNCLDELAEWGNNNDIAEKEFAYPSHEGVQTVTTYTVGFDFDLTDPDLVAAEQLMRDTATRGGGSFYVADDQTSLNQAFAAIVAEILAVNSTFSSPAVSVNAFNRATNLDDLYFTLFKPALGEHWEGNFKKFKLEFDATTGDPFIADQTGSAAIDNTTGFFTDTSSSYWTQAADSPDGSETAVGGAASRQIVPGGATGRKVYTMTAAYTDDGSGVMTLSAIESDLTTAENRLVESNTDVTETMLDIVGALPLIGITPYRTSLIDWASGIDVLDQDVDGSVVDARRIMGDPLHAEPGLVQYGLTGADADGNGFPDDADLVAYVATNDGYIHAVNTLTGLENFVFVPQEMLPKLDNIFQDTGVNGKQYGLDGNVIPWMNDDDGDGYINDGGDTAYLYFGMRRGGRDIYSLDVTDRDLPKLRWKIEGGVGDYAELGQTWSTVNVEKILIDDTERTVLIFGGGYDTGQDTALTRTVDSEGRGVFIVDAITGALLWRAGINTDTNADLQLDDMKYSIPARIKPLDIDGDGYIDRLYTGDMGGQLWRFDIDNVSNTTAGGLSVVGGVLADLATDGSVNTARRFYYPPDVALIVQEGQPPFISVVAASGYRAHPLNSDIQDRMYMIRDFDVYTSPDFASASYTPVVEADLFDTTSNDIGSTDTATRNTALTSLSTAAGWYISLQQSDGSFVGEKGLSEPLILGGVAIMTTFIPASAGINLSACKANDGTGSLYFVNVTNGTPAYDLSGDITSPDSRSIYLDRGGIPPSPSVIITEEGTPTLCVGTECDRAGPVSAAEKMYWYEK